MKIAITLLFLVTYYFIPAVAQKSKKESNGYMMLYGGVSPKEGSNKGLFGLSVGTTSQDALGIGLGFGFIKFDKPYIPVTLDVSYFGKKHKATPALLLKGGYGVYSNAGPFGDIRGGFTGSANAGFSLPAGKAKVIVLGGLGLYSFSYKQRVLDAKTQEKRWHFMFVFKF